MTVQMHLVHDDFSSSKLTSMEKGVEDFLSHRYWPEDNILASLRSDIHSHTTPIAVNAETGKFLSVIVKACGARNILEVGTLFGYSAICMARSLPADGHLDTIELSSFHADSAERWFKEAGVAKKIHIHRGSSDEVLPTLKGPYDLAFLDADKTRYISDGEYAIDLLRPGGVLLADNMIWSGKIANKHATDDATEGVRAFHAFISGHDDLISTVLPVGDGLAVCVKKG